MSSKQQSSAREPPASWCRERRSHHDFLAQTDPFLPIDR